MDNLTRETRDGGKHELEARGLTERRGGPHGPLQTTDRRPGRKAHPAVAVIVDGDEPLLPIRLHHPPVMAAEAEWYVRQGDAHESPMKCQGPGDICG